MRQYSIYIMRKSFKLHHVISPNQSHVFGISLFPFFFNLHLPP